MSGPAARCGRPRRGRPPPPSGGRGRQVGDHRAPGARPGASTRIGTSRRLGRGRPADDRRRSRRAGAPAARPGRPAARRAPRARRRRRARRPRPGGRGDASGGSSRRRRAPAAGPGRRERRPPGGAEVLRDRVRVVTGRTMGRWEPVSSAPGACGPVVCPRGETSRPAFGPWSQSARRRAVRIIRRRRDQTRRGPRAMPRLRQKNVVAAQWSPTARSATGDLTAPRRRRSSEPNVFGPDEQRTAPAQGRLPPAPGHDRAR